MVYSLPFIIIGSIFLILGNIPIKSVADAINASGWGAIFAQANNTTFQMMGLWAAIGIAYVYVKNENYEYLTFLTTYIIPLICIDLTKVRYVIVLGVLLVLIGFIFIRMDLYYGNPTLALMGYRLYRAEIKGCEAPDGIILISRDRLNKASSIKWIPIDEYVWIAKEIKNDI